MNFQQMLQKLTEFWEKQGCAIHQGYDLEVGAGTFNPATFLRCLGPEPYTAAYIEPSRRPADGRYGLNPVRYQHYFQYQVMLKPSPLNVQDLCLQSLEAIGFNLNEHDIRFVHDDWESPTLGAWGLGWEVWMDGMEVLQFTYFQSCGGQELKPVTGELTYGLERLATYLQKKEGFPELKYSDTLTYGDIYFENEVEFSHYNFEEANIEMWHRHFNDFEKEANALLKKNLPIPAYDFVMKASHAFNMLDARGAISVTERTGYIGRIRDLARKVAEGYIKRREEMGFPLLKNKIARKQEPLAALVDDTRKTGDFLLEIGSEELPALFVPIGIANLEKGMKALLDENKLSYKSLKAYGAPRRLAVLVEGLDMERAAEKIEKRGPQVDAAFDAAGNLTDQGRGYLEANGFKSITRDQLNRIAGLKTIKVKDKEHIAVEIEKPSEKTAQILQNNLAKLILNIDFPKKMRWSDLDIAYARPLRWVVSLLNENVVPFHIGDLTAGRTTQGHRQLNNVKRDLKQAKDYLETLKSLHVLADQEERKASIQKQLKEIESKENANAVYQDKVLNQVLHLTEWPMLTVADFDPEFLKVPKEVPIMEMVEHQKYFPLENKDGSLKNRFVITANNTPTDEVRRGNQKVLSARLKDGVFLYNQDLKIKLDDFNQKLKTVIFQKELGSVFDKVERIEHAALKLQKALAISTEEKVKKAALYSKADLASHMVYEFPELQGTMGKYYAEKAMLDSEVALAIEEHWMPKGENAPLPKSPTGIILSLAEKFDNLNSCYRVGLKPTSSSDPYALRRQVLGIIRILIENKLSLPLKEFVTDSDALQFITQRIKTVFLDYGFEKDEIEASLSSNVEDIYDTYLRVKALHEFRKTRSEFKMLAEVFKRARGQLEGQKINGFNPSHLKEKSEKDLYEKLTSLKIPFSEAIKKQNYPAAYEQIALLQKPLDTLFSEVKILDENLDVRSNRLSLLKDIFALFGELIDFSKIKTS